MKRLDWALVDRGGLDDCWIWKGSVNNGGYGPHSESYEQVHGPVPSGLEIDHTCNVRRCVNPKHLEAVTKAENNRRAVERRTSCRRGHERTTANIYWYKGTQLCRVCRRMKWKRRTKDA